MIAKASIGETCTETVGGIEADLAAAITENDGTVACLAISITRDLARLIGKRPVRRTHLSTRPALAEPSGEATAPDPVFPPP